MRKVKPKLSCRVCLLHQQGQLISIFSTLNGISVLDAIENITGLKDIRFDRFTKVVCQPCADNVIIAYKTKIQCLLSDATLRSTIQPKQDDEEDDEEVEPIQDVEQLYVDKDFGPGLVIEPVGKLTNEGDTVENQVAEMHGGSINELDNKYLYEEHFVDENELTMADVKEEVLDEQIETLDDEEEMEMEEEEEELDDNVSSIESFTNGKKTHANSLYKRSCCQCLEMFATNEDVMLHFNMMHPEHIKSHIDLLPPDAEGKQCVLCHSLVGSLQTHRRRKHFKDYKVRMEQLGVQKYECIACDIQFASKQKLSCHQKYHHSKGDNSQIKDVTTCPICIFKFKSANYLDKHLLEEHPDEKNSIECKICQKKMKLATSMKKHMRIHFSERTFHCDQCDESYLYSCDLERHKLQHDKKRGLNNSLKKGKRSFEILEELKIEDEENTEEQDDTVESEPVSIKQEKIATDDDEIIIDSQYLESKPTTSKRRKVVKMPVKMKREEINRMQHYCCKCRETFVEEYELVNHFNETHPNKVKIHYEPVDESDGKRTQCTLCLNYVKDMFRHRRRQHAPTPPKKDYQCITCGRVFKTPAAMKECERKHTGLKPERLQCPKCPATLSSKSNLSEHIKLHSEIYRFECHLCGKRCKKSSNLKVHLESTHSDEKNVKCEICGKAMKKKSSMAIHMRIHTGDRPFKCNYCENTYIHRTDWKRHEMVHTGYRPYKCEICDRGFIKKSSLMEHEKTHIVTL